MSRGHKRSIFMSALSAAVLMVAGQAALAAEQELPFRQRVSNCVAVLRYLYKGKLDYMDKLKLYEYNVNVTETQFETVRGLFEGEARQKTPDIEKLKRYQKSLIDLIDQFHQFAGPQYYDGLKEMKGSLEEAMARLQALPETEEEAAPAPAAPAAPAAAPTPEAAPAPAAPTAATPETAAPAGGLGSAASELETPAPAAPVAPTAAASPTPAEAAAPAAPAAAAKPSVPQGGIKQTIADLTTSVKSLQTKIDGYNAANFIDYVKLYNTRVAELDTQLTYYESVLNARVAEYHALFGMAPPVNLEYRSELERLHPATATPGLLVVE